MADNFVSSQNPENVDASSARQSSPDRNRTLPTFNLKAVVHETGLKPDTLRAWERRYGLPQPRRTAGGHRLYVQRDIDTLKWLIARQNEGLSISRAVEMWRSITADDNDPLDEVPINPAEPAPSTVSTGTTLIGMRDKWIAACLKFDEQAADLTLSQALAMYPVETVCLELMQRGLAEIGIGWFEGTVSAQQEHFASALAMRKLEALISTTPPPTRTGRIFVGCPPEEQHTFAPLLLTLLLHRRGWEALYLGANVPLARLESTLDAVAPRMIILTAQTLYTASTMLAMAQLLEKQGTPFGFGGLIFNSLPTLQKQMPGHFLGLRLEQAPIAVEQLLASTQRISDPNPLPEIGPEYEEMLNHYLQQQARVEATVWDLLQPYSIRPNYLARANRDLSRSIIAALTLGDIRLIGADMHWIEGLLMNYHYRMPQEMVSHYFDAYHQATATTLGEKGKLIVDWLGHILVTERDSSRENEV